MKLTKRIDKDCRCLENYFRKLFELVPIGIAEEKAAPMQAEDADADESQAPYHGFSHFIKPDMLINICSLYDFWIRELCRYHKITKHLPLACDDIKGRDELQAFHKYLTLYAGLDLNSVQASYLHLQGLRKVRNRFIHSGGHIPEDKEKEYAGIPGISLSMRLIGFKDDYIWASLDHAKKYLKAIAKA